MVISVIVEVYIQPKDLRHTELPIDRYAIGVSFWTNTETPILGRVPKTGGILLKFKSYSIVGDTCQPVNGLQPEPEILVNYSETFPVAGPRQIPIKRRS